MGHAALSGARALTAATADAPVITWKSWLMVATLGFTWGGTFLVIELALEEWPPFWLASGRILFGLSLMLIVWRVTGLRLFSRPPSLRTWLALVAVSAFSTGVPFMLLAWGQQHVTSGFAGVSMASVALIVLPLAHIFIPGERMTPRRSAGFVIGFIGVSILIGGRRLTPPAPIWNGPGGSPAFLPRVATAFHLS